MLPGMSPENVGKLNGLVCVAYSVESTTESNTPAALQPPNGFEDRPEHQFRLPSATIVEEISAHVRCGEAKQKVTLVERSFRRLGNSPVV